MASLRRSLHRWIAPASVALLACGASAGVTPADEPSGGPAGTPVPAAARPTLVVVLTIDQFRADYLTRFGHQLTGGLARLLKGGAHFTNAHQDHAIPETAAGHAVLLSGRFPRSTNIILNSGSVQDDSAPLVGARGAGASPRQFLGTTLVDWLQRENAGTRALSVSGKDRSAILPIGRAREHVYWYTGEGRIATSAYYRDALPAWVEAFNARDLARRRAGQAWVPLLPASAYTERDAEPLEAGGHGNTFPHRLPADSAAAASYLIVTPWLDELLLDFALAGVNALRLGAETHTDVLSISLSASDAVGHVYGPDSKEMHDQVLRLDRMLGSFLDSLYRLRGRSHVVVALTSDHGVARLPELASRKDELTAWRVDVEEVLGATRAGLERAGVPRRAVDVYLGLVVMDRAALERGGLRPDSVAEALAAQMRRYPGIARVDKLRDLQRREASRDATTRRWLHMLPASAQVELVATLEPNSIWLTGNIASHHSPHDYDTHVPLVLYGPPFKPGRYGSFVRVVDLAPTLAAVVGVRPGEKLDGVVLKEALR